MTRPRKVRAASACAALLFVPTATATTASAATTIRGTVIGAPTSTAATATVPILLSVASGRALHTRAAVVRVRVPSRRGIRALSGVLAPGGLRIGDRVHAEVGRLRDGGVRTSTLRVSTRGGAASFDRLERSRTQARERAQAAAEAVARLDATGSGVQGATAPSPTELREQLMALRYDLNVLIADLRELGGQTTDAIARIERERPADAKRNAVVTRRQAPLIAALNASRTELDEARKQLEDAVTRLDAAILDVGGASAPSVPIGTVGTVSDVVQAVLFILGELEFPTGR